MCFLRSAKSELHTLVVVVSLLHDTTEEVTTLLHWIVRVRDTPLSTPDITLKHEHEYLSKLVSCKT